MLHPLDEEGNTRERLARIEQITLGTRTDVGKIERMLDAYLTKVEFWAHFSLVRTLTFGAAAIILSGVVVAIVALVVRR